jgi:hypothetical protein
MEWKSLEERFKDIPLILAGPILRRTEPNAVTVWVALKEAKEVELEIFSSDNLVISVLSGKKASFSLGDNLHIAVVTATPKSTELQPGNNYLYNLTIDGKKLEDPRILSKEGGIGAICYGDFSLPSFALPPENLTDLRLVHGSCRKPHAEGRDALESVDLMIQGVFESVSNDAQIANQRPHQLFLTGDQIYADDVADSLLFMLTDAAKVLLGLGWDENLPGVNRKLSELKNPGKRQKISEQDCGFTSSEAKSHLLGFGEFCAMYLFAWSDLLWPSIEDFPIFEEVLSDKQKTFFEKVLSNQQETFKQEINYLKEFLQTLKTVRKILANVPIYMICDDHEVTDDWFINLRWCQQVISKPLGRRVLQNGLLTYALFQALGNTPKAFEGGKGFELIQTIPLWKGSDNDQDKRLEKILSNCLGLPGNEQEAKDFIEDINKSRQLLHFSSSNIPIPDRPWHNSINWHYTIAWKNHEVIFLDTRTWREYPREKQSNSPEDKDEDNIGFPALLSEQGFIEQLPEPSLPQSKVTFIISAGPVLGVPLVEGTQAGDSSYDERIKNDTEAWNLEKTVFEILIARLALRGNLNNLAKEQPVILLSGDVHYGFTVRLQYWGKKPYKQKVILPEGQKEFQRVIVQLTSSSLKNETGGLFGTRRLHDFGYRILDILPFDNPLEPPKKVLGWDLEGEKKLKIGEKATIEEPNDLFDWEVTGNPATIDLKEEEGIFTNLSLDSNSKATPDWRYYIDYQLAKFGEKVKKKREINPENVTIPPPNSSREQVLQQYLDMSENHLFYTEKWGSGNEIVGVNNIGEISFKEGDNRLTVIHSLWWRLRSHNKTFLQFFPLTVYEVPLNLNSSERPTVEGEVL